MTKTTSMPKLKTNFRNEIVFWRPWNISTYLENKNLICMYMSYWGNLNLHIDVHEIIFSSPSTFGKYYCSSSLFMPWFNPSLSLSETHTLYLSCSVFPSYTCFCVRFFCEWPSRSIQYSSVLGLLLLIYPLIF